MNKKRVLVTALAASIAVEEVVFVGRSENLALQPHTHFEIPNEPFTVAVSESASSNVASVMVDNEAYSPTLPWASWWQADRNQMVAAQKMIQLGSSQDDLMFEKIPKETTIKG